MTTEFGPIRNLIFDLDGTLIDSYTAICESFNYALHCFNLAAAPEAVIREMVGEKLEKMFRPYLPPELIDAAVAKYRERYRRVFLQKTLLLPGVAEALENLARCGFALGIATNKPAFFTNDILRNLAIDHYFAAVVGSEMVTQPKPHPEMVLAVLQEMGGSPEDTLYVGDAPIDIETGKNAGVGVLAVATGSVTREKLQAAGPLCIYNCLAELAAALTGRED